MTDLEITKLCLDADGRESVFSESTNRHMLVYRAVWDNNCKSHEEYDPLTNDAQAMALVKKFRLDIDSGFDSDEGRTDWQVIGTGAIATNSDLNRAIVECVAKMQQAKSTTLENRGQQALPWMG